MVVTEESINTNTPTPGFEDQTSQVGRIIFKGVAALIIVAGAGIGISVYKGHEDALVARANERGLVNTLGARGLSLSHMTLMPDGSGYEAIYDNKSEGANCKLGFEILDQDKNPSEPFLRSVSITSSETKDAITGTDFGNTHNYNYDDITNSIEESEFFKSIPSSVCK